jgi:Skp family chaperone for outer membrane proteins
MVRKSTGFFALTVIGCVAFSLGAGTARAATDPPAFRIAYIDLMEVQEKAIPIRDALARAEKKIEPMQKEIEAKIEELDVLDRSLRNASLLSKATVAENQRKAEALQDEIELLGFQIDRELGKAVDQTTSEAGQLIVEAIEDTAKAKGFAMVVSKDSLLYAIDSCDMTAAVIERLNGAAAKGAPALSATEFQGKPTAKAAK